MMKCDYMLDADWQPFFLDHKTYQQHCKESTAARPTIVSLQKPDGTVSQFSTLFLPDNSKERTRNVKQADQLVKFLLWQRGAAKVQITGIPEITAELAKRYAHGGQNAFDAEFFTRVYGSFSIEDGTTTQLPPPKESARELGRNWNGCRIGFDLGGSDRKCAAVKDGEVLFTEEIRWDPYFQTDPQYHIDGIRDSLRRAAAHLPRIDAIGGSCAGVYIENQPRVASLFRGIPEEKFETWVKPIFTNLQKEWGGIPFEVVNDGDVTALAGSMGGGKTSLLGVSLGTSMAVGYVDARGRILPWLNELAFAPFDSRSNGPIDEWSGGIGVGAQFFSQQGVARLAKLAGISFSDETALPEQLVAIQSMAQAEDQRALAIFRTIGHCLGFAVAQCADFYDLKHVMALGRVTSGAGGEILLATAQASLDKISNDHGIEIFMPGEKEKRHGQAVAAASLPQV